MASILHYLRCQSEVMLNNGRPSAAFLTELLVSNANARAISHPSWWRHQMETFCALLTRYEGYPPVTGRFPSQRTVPRRFDILFDLRLNKRLSKQSRCWWFETPSRWLIRHCSVGARPYSAWVDPSWFYPSFRSCRLDWTSREDRWSMWYFISWGCIPGWLQRHLFEHTNLSRFQSKCSWKKLQILFSKRLGNDRWHLRWSQVVFIFPNNNR